MVVLVHSGKDPVVGAMCAQYSLALHTQSRTRLPISRGFCGRRSVANQSDPFAQALAETIAVLKVLRRLQRLPALLENTDARA